MGTHKILISIEYVHRSVANPGGGGRGPGPPPLEMLKV